MNRKQRIVQRYQKQLKHHKTLAERKELAERARARKSENEAGGRRGARTRHGEDDDEDELFEKMSSHRGPLRSAGEVRKAFNEVLSRQRGELEATVLEVHRARLELLVGERRESAPVPSSMTGGRRSHFAVGDTVTLTRAEDGGLRVRTVEERRSEISRADPSDPRVKHTLAANVDLAVITTSARTPPFKPGLIDRFLVVLQRGGVDALLCLNKVDLFESAPDREAVHRRLRVYPVPFLETSSSTGQGIDELRARLAGRTVVFLGQSGVGKSSLLNALAPSVRAATGGVRSTDGKGKHTTTSSSMHGLGEGTRVIDTPGIRSLGLWKLEPEELAAEFPEFTPFAAECRFRDCLHSVEPACAVRAAAESGEIPGERFASYLRILASMDA